ncbi:MAG TPA: 2-amino-4-hydroxy-6-hydroxymethyldihydropteridine diphosphokinase [Gammaproteobacteria bacterium]|nr:2-amino-4-hydroxy-6-hydroxymethyldihydropteridine diphosphokinase [Gammaproteobacteria bacterium]
MPEVYVGVGSNIDAEAHLKLAVRSLEDRFGRLCCSDVFRSPSFGFEGEDFLNMVVGFSTPDGPDRVEQILSAIEYAGGRTREAARYVPRTLDLDLLLYGAMVDPRRRLPREDVLRYPFVLGPLADLAPALPHPVSGVTLGAAWRAMAARPVALERLGSLEAPA